MNNEGNESACSGGVSRHVQELIYKTSLALRKMSSLYLTPTELTYRAYYLKRRNILALDSVILHYISDLSNHTLVTRTILR